MKATVGIIIFAIAVVYSIIFVPMQYFSCIGKGGVPVEQVGYIACVSGVPVK